MIRQPSLDSNVCNSTPLHLAAIRKTNYEVIRALISYGSDIGSSNHTGKTPLHRFFTPATRRILQTYDGFLEPHVQDEDGMTLIHYLSWSSMTTPSEFDRALGADPLCLPLRDNMGRSVLHLAASRGNVVLFSHILSMRGHPDPNEKDHIGAGLLHYAVHSKRTQLIDLAYSCCKDLFALDSRGRSVLHYAVVWENTAAMRKIFELGGEALIRCKDLDGRTPRMLAEAKGFIRVVEFFDNQDGGDEAADATQIVESRVPASTLCVAGAAPILRIQDLVLLMVLVVVVLWVIFARFWLST